MNENGQDILPKSRGSRSSPMSKSGRQVALGDVYVLENNTVRVVVDCVVKEAGSDTAVSKDKFGDLDAPFDSIEHAT
jgi:hypothetical protein